MFAVVEHEQQHLCPQRRDERVGYGLTGPFLNAERGRNRVRDCAGVADRGKFDKPYTVGVFRPQRAGHFKRQPRFPASARSCKGEQAGTGQETSDFCDLIRSADEAGERKGEIGGRATGRERGP